MAPVPHLYQIGTGANFLNGTGVGANFSNGTSAKHFQTLAPVPCFEWHRCHTFTKLALVPLMYMAPMPVCQMAPVGCFCTSVNDFSRLRMRALMRN